MADFIQQLRDQGYNVEELSDGKIAFDYQVQFGRFLNQTIKLGFIVPGDFPLNPPSGPHISPRLLPINAEAGNHPLGGVHESSGFGTDWEYWSRPYPNWANTDRSAKTYMRYIEHLLQTA